MSTDKEFYDLLNSISNEQTFSFDLISTSNDPITIKCKPLTTLQLKDLVKSAVDSPLTQAAFNSTATKVFSESLVENTGFQLNVIDRLIFLLETRINSFSAIREVEQEDKTITINYREVLTKLRKELTAKLISPQSATEGKVTVHYGVPYISTELKMNEELYKNVDFEIKDTEELRKVIGDAFINEIAKSVDAVIVTKSTDQQSIMDLSKLSFKERIKIIESLPASLIQQIINYIEKYKKVIEKCITVDGYIIPIDSTLFSTR